MSSKPTSKPSSSSPRQSLSIHEQSLRLPWLDRKSPLRVAIVGDLILDEYLDGSVSRISPEAPVPVHRVKDSRLSAGGAANVALNVQLSGGKALMFGVLGEDQAADKLIALLETRGVDCSGIVKDPKRPTIRKTRITASHQQLVRIDWEELRPIDQELQGALEKRLGAEDWDVLLLSDYAKGCLPHPLTTRLIAMARSLGRPVLVDPKGKNYGPYAGASLITPNRKEAFEALALDSEAAEELCPSPSELAQQLKERFGFSEVLVTLGPEGMLGLNQAGEQRHLSAQAKEVFDVSGAGDTVVALMALAQGQGLPLFTGMEYASVAAGLAVEKWGTQPVSAEEITGALEQQRALSQLRHKGASKASAEFKGTESKVFSQLSELKAFCEKCRQDGIKLVFTNGCFDILHAGHISYLEKARQLGGRLIVGVNSDSSVRRLKGESRPINPEAQRQRLLSALACVDAVICFEEDTPEELISALEPDVLVKGADYSLEAIVGHKTVLARGGQVHRIDMVEGLSTTAVIKKLQSQGQEAKGLK